MDGSGSLYWCCTRSEGSPWQYCPTLGDVPKLLAEGQQVWVDILRPGPDDLKWLEETFGFHHLTLSDVMNNETRPKQEAYDDVLFTVFGAINLNPGEEALDTVNLNLYLTKQYVVTVHLKPANSVRQLKETIEQRRELLHHGPDYLFYRLLDGLIDKYFEEFDEIDEQLDALERRVFSDDVVDVQAAVFDLKKRVAILRSSLGPKRDVLKILVYAEFDQITKETQTLLRDVLDHVLRMWDMLDSQRELLNGLMDSYMIQLSNRLNEVMKLLSVIVTIMLPLSFITGIFGMNFHHIPGLDSAGGFWGVMGFMAAIAAAMLVAFKRKKIL